MECPIGKVIAMNPGSSLRDLHEVANSYYDEVLANPAMLLLSLEDPALYKKVYLTARNGREQNKANLALETIPVEEWRRVMVRTAELLRDDISGYEPRPDLGISPLPALEIAKRYLAGKCSRQTLSWGARFAQTFIDWKAPKKVTQKEKLHIDITKILAEACKACCASDRRHIWSGIEVALVLLGPSSQRQTIEQYDAREKILDELLGTKAKKKGRRP